MQNQAKNNKEFQAFYIQEIGSDFTSSIITRKIDSLPDGDLLIKVSYSSLNYKDALSSTGNKGVTKKYPHTPGIDAVGIIEESNDDRFQIGDTVIVTGFDLGMNTSGGFAEYIRVPAEWAIHLPKKLDTVSAMMIGTAGLTAAAMVKKVAAHTEPEAGDILVTGATGGVGIISVLLLKLLGYNVIASTGKLNQEEFLLQTGAARVIDRNEISNPTSRPLLKSAWAGAIDTVGGATLENVVKSTNQYGIVTCCGNVASADLNLTVFPFILRGITLAGISSQNQAIEERISLWKYLSEIDSINEKLDAVSNIITMEELDLAISDILKGKITGRTVIQID